MTWLHDDLIKKPNSTDTFDQGNIFTKVYFPSLKKSIFGILLTPICDQQNRDNQNINFHFCAVLDFKPLFLKYYNKVTKDVLEQVTAQNISAGKKKDLANKMLGVIGNRVNSWHWLGKFPDTEGYWYVNFELQSSFIAKSLADIDNGERIAMLKSPLRESVSSRFSAYMGRIGLPWEDKDQETLAEQIINEYL